LQFKHQPFEFVRKLPADKILIAFRCSHVGVHRAGRMPSRHCLAQVRLGRRPGGSSSNPIPNWSTKEEASYVAPQPPRLRNRGAPLSTKIVAKTQQDFWTFREPL